MEPWTVLREAVKKVPAMKYALAIAGLIAVIAIVQQLKVGEAHAIVGTLLVLGGMVLFLVFSAAAALGPGELRLPATVLIWFVLCLFIAGCLILFSAVFFGKPPIASLPWAMARTETATPVPQQPAHVNVEVATPPVKDPCTGPRDEQPLECLGK